MTKAFIKLTTARKKNPLYINVDGILGFGPAYGEPNRGTFVKSTSNELSAINDADESTSCWIVIETPQEIMEQIDRAQALVHALT